MLNGTVFFEANQVQASQLVLQLKLCEQLYGRQFDWVSNSKMLTMKKLLILSASFLFLQTNAQNAVHDTSAQLLITSISSANLSNNQHYQGSSPYKTTFKKDFPVTAGLIGLNVLGLNLIQNKSPLTEAEVLTKDPDDVPGFDRGNVGYYDESVDEASYPVMYVGYALPVAVALLDGKQRNRFGQVLVLYTETMAVTGALFSITAGAVDRARPLVYASHAPMDVRMSKNSQRSFYAGHTASVATSTFFMAKLFNDFHPDSKLKPWVWVVGAAVPAYIGWSRYKSGHHFLSDNIVGYVLGAATGILVPHFHKTSKIKQNMSIVPVIDQNYRGMSLTYKF